MRIIQLTDDLDVSIYEWVMRDRLNVCVEQAKKIDTALPLRSLYQKSWLVEAERVFALLRQISPGFPMPDAMRSMIESRDSSGVDILIPGRSEHDR